MKSKGGTTNLVTSSCVHLNILAQTSVVTAMNMERPVVFYFAALITLAAFPLVTPKADFARLQRIKPWNITLSNNSYDVLVGISDDIPESQGPGLVENMKRIMRAASSKLGNITGGRARFNEVTIVVPYTWTSYSVYSDGETVSRANFFINPGDSSNTEPVVQMYLKGTSTNPYRAILLPSTYVERIALDNNVGNVITEKWLKFRYDIVGSYNDLLRELQREGMCANPNLENPNCKKLRKDLDWQVFPPLHEPSFRVVRQRSKRVVMIIDVSNSMTGNRLDKAKSGFKQYIKSEEDRPRTSLALVKFSTTAQTLHNLSNEETVKVGMINTVDDLRPDDRTSIGAGLEEALQVLNRHPEKTNGAEFILISDGEENQRPFINRTATKVINSNITVHTIAITNLTDTRLDALGAATGGLSYIHVDDEQGNDLGVAFGAIHGYDESDPASSGIVIFSERRTTSNPAFTILVDDLIGKDTTFVFECPLAYCSFTVNIDSPDQRNFLQYMFSSAAVSVKTKDYEIKPNSRAGQLDIKIFDAKAGSWNVRTTSNNSVLGLTVNTYPRDISNYPILAFSFWGRDQIFADDCATNQTMYTLISRDNNPVTGASVMATIESSTKQSTYAMYDDGKGRDIAKDDGIYTGVFPDSIRDLTKTERFNLKVKVDGTTATQVRTRQLVAATFNGRMSPVPDQGGERVERLQRFVLGGSYIAMKRAPDSCKVCNMDLVVLFYSPMRQEDLKSFLLGIIVFYTTAMNNTRVKIGIVDAGVPDHVIIYPDYVDSVVTAFTQWLLKGSSSGQVDFATGLRTAGRLFNNDNRRKVVLLMSDTDTANTCNVHAARVEADGLRAGGINVIAVGVGKVPGFFRQVIQDHQDIMEVDDYIPSKNTPIVNKACGFMVKKPQQL